MTGTDRDGTLIAEMRQYLQTARQYNILVFPTLWNAAVNQNTHARLDGLIKVIKGISIKQNYAWLILLQRGSLVVEHSLHI